MRTVFAKRGPWRPPKDVSMRRTMINSRRSSATLVVAESARLLLPPVEMSADEFGLASDVGDRVRGEGGEGSRTSSTSLSVCLSLSSGFGSPVVEVGKTPPPLRPSARPTVAAYGSTSPSVWSRSGTLSFLAASIASVVELPREKRSGSE